MKNRSLGIYMYFNIMSFYVIINYGDISAAGFFLFFLFLGKKLN